MNQVMNYTINKKSNVNPKGGVIYNILNMMWTAFFFMTMVIFIVGAIIIWAIPASILKLVKAKLVTKNNSTIVNK